MWGVSAITVGAAQAYPFFHLGYYPTCHCSESQLPPANFCIFSFRFLQGICALSPQYIVIPNICKNQCTIGMALRLTMHSFLNS